MEHKQSSGLPQGRQKMNYACEACRAAKTKCQSGPQPDICKRCSEFKRECIFRTGPRTRRTKASRIDPEAAVPPPPGPSKTFSIDFEMPAAEDPSDSFETLRQQHEQYLDDLVFDDGDNEIEQQVIEEIASLAGNNLANPRPFSFNDLSSSSPSLSVSGSSSAWTESSARKPKSKPMMNLGIKPQFNLDSATKLLASFQNMLPHLPFLVLPEDVNIRSLAKDSPFVLLAILAVTSCSSSLQGHSLYDEEFRKVLGLKFVAGGERSLELLQGILIYCSWYPFHLRPKNKQSFQYMRMGVDIVHDLEMDREPDLDLFSMAPDQRARQLVNIRALLGCYYGMSAFSVTWGKVSSTLRYTPQLSACADLLEQNSELEQDRHLVWLVRLQYIYEELIESQRSFDRGPRDYQSEMQRSLIRVGLEAQFRDFKERMPPQYASTTSILLQSLLTEAFFFAPALLRMPRKFGAKDFAETVAPDRLLQAAHKVRAIFDRIASQPARDFGGLSGPDYGRFIIAVILAYRLSFPMLGICRDYNVAQGRRVLDLAEVLRKLIEMPDEDDVPGLERESGKSKAGNGSGNGNAGGAGTPTKKPRKSDAVSALRVVLGSVKRKFEEKSAAFEAMSAAAGEEWGPKDLKSTCPMLNGSLDQYIPLWSGQQSEGSDAVSKTMSQATSSGVMMDALSSVLGVDPGTPFAGPMGQMGLGMGMGPFEDKPLMYHDLWATMTMGWTGEMGEVNMEDIGNTGYGDMLDQV
ncbi:hypothetical protein GGR51DRAFT_499284 [Nemania sp. FL0031]|nr:hypothetical protein GGR51DRAFT_499284 [Nemania sp. FL0031]